MSKDKITAEEARVLLQKNKTPSKQRVKADKRKALTDIAETRTSAVKSEIKLITIKFKVGDCTVIHHCLPELVEMVKKAY